jgi:hypothetical protein
LGGQVVASVQHVLTPRGRRQTARRSHLFNPGTEIRLSSSLGMVGGMTATRQRTYPEPVVKRLYALSGNRCAFLGCETRLTDQVAPGEPPTNLGKIAHIVGLGRQGPRADPTIPAKDLNRVENLLLLCGVHHDLVDANPRIFSVEVLATYKANHEARIEGASTPPQPTLTVETVDLSLLPITHLPERVWSAVPTRRTTEEIAAGLPLPEQGEVLPFYLHAGRIHTFHDLTAPKGPFRGLIEHATVDDATQADLLAKPDRRVVFVRLLNKALDRWLRPRGSGSTGSTVATTSWPTTRRSAASSPSGPKPAASCPGRSSARKASAPPHETCGGIWPPASPSSSSPATSGA